MWLVLCQEYNESNKPTYQPTHVITVTAGGGELLNTNRENIQTDRQKYKPVGDWISAPSPNVVDLTDYDRLSDPQMKILASKFRVYTVHWTCCRGFKMHQLVWYTSLSVQYKLCTPMYTIHHGLSPVYLSEQVNTVAAQTLRRGLRSASTTNYTIPRLLTKFGERAFSFAGPTAWNSLPHELRAAPTLNSFKRRLKTHLFNTAFNR